VSIFDETRWHETITEGERALELFTDRHEAIRRFSEYLNAEPPRKSILFFHGDGGNGKSLLLKFLLKHYCKRLSEGNWEFVRSHTGEEFEANLKNAQDAQDVPLALLDFGMKPVGEDRPLEAFSGLLMLRRALAHSVREAGYRLRFPLYDYACVWYLHKTGGLSKERLQSLFPAEEVEFIGEIVNALSQTSWGTLGKTVLNIFSKHSREWFTLYSQRRRLDETQLERIQMMEPQSELIDHLPHLFAEDLNVGMSAERSPERIVLLFDTHEAFWGSQRDLSNDLFFQRDEWLRRLLGTLDLSSGIVAIVAGRDRPRWPDAVKHRIPEEYVDSFLVGHLSEAHAEQYLERASISDASMRRCLVAYALVGTDQVHPLYLGLCADIVLAAAEKGVSLSPEDFRVTSQTADKGAALVDRLLRYVDVEIGFAVLALCASRAFDLNLYLKLGQALNFAASEPAFRAVLTRFSFVWRAPGHGRDGQDWYRIHELLRRLARQRDDDVCRRAHEFLDEYYFKLGEEGDVAATAEAFYHANRLDSARGVGEWVNTFENALQNSHYELCGALLNVRRELIIETDAELGQVSSAEGSYFAALARYEEAMQEYSEAIRAYDEALRQENDFSHVHNKALVFAHLGTLQTQLSQHKEAEENYEKAIAAYDEALKLAPERAIIYTNKGSALTSLGELRAGLARYEEAEANQMEAIAAHGEALRLEPDYINAHVNNGITLLRLGILYSLLSQHERAIESYAAASAACDEALRLAPDFLPVYHNKAVVSGALGELQAQLAQYDEATKSYEEAIAAYDEALRLAPDDILARLNKGFTLITLGDLEAQLSRHEKAKLSCGEALAACDEVLRRAPDHVEAHDNRGTALLKRGELQFSLGEYVAAADSYRDAVAAYDEALRRSPDHVLAHVNKATTLSWLGGLHAFLSRHGEAIKSYEESIAAYDKALGLAPDHILALANKGAAFVRRGELQADLSQHAEAIKSYEEAIAICGKALRRSPDYIVARVNIQVTLIRLGDSQTALSLHKDAEESYRKSMTTCDETLELAPDHVLSYLNKGTALTNLGDLYASLSYYDEAGAAYGMAVAAYDGSLKHSPDHVLARVNIAAALLRLGKLQAQLFRHEEAIKNYKKAIVACEEVLRHAPENAHAHANRGIALQCLSASQGSLAQLREACESLQSALAEYSWVIGVAPDNEWMQKERDRLQKIFDGSCNPNQFSLAKIENSPISVTINTWYGSS